MSKLDLKAMLNQSLVTSPNGEPAAATETAGEAASRPERPVVPARRQATPLPRVLRPRRRT